VLPASGKPQDTNECHIFVKFGKREWRRSPGGSTEVSALVGVFLYTRHLVCAEIVGACGSGAVIVIFTSGGRLPPEVGPWLRCVG